MVYTSSKDVFKSKSNNNNKAWWRKTKSSQNVRETNEITNIKCSVYQRGGQRRKEGRSIKEEEPLKDDNDNDNFWLTIIKKEEEEGIGKARVKG